MGTKETWEKINREPVSQDIHLKRVMRGCLAFIRGRDIGMFCAYRMEPKYGIKHFIEHWLR